MGLNFSYKVKEHPNGRGEAFILGEDFIGDDGVCLILGDNIYKVDNYYNAEADGGFSFKTPELGIDWPIELDQAITSEKDSHQPTFTEFENDNPFVYGEI